MPESLSKMGMPLPAERRQFVRIRLEVPVLYKFLCQHRQDPELREVYEGTTRDISAGGILLHGKVALLDWVPELLQHKIAVGVNLFLPEDQVPIKALARVAWIEPIEARTNCCALGLGFREITQQDKDRIFRYVIKSQIKV